MAISADCPHDAMMTLAKDIYEQMEVKVKGRSIPPPRQAGRKRELPRKLI
jgi:hypothetical protein